MDMLHYFWNDKEKIKALGLSKASIWSSIFLTIAHTVLEVIQLYCEAQACRMDLIQYCVVCFNGKFGFVPFMNILSEYSQISVEDLESMKSNHPSLF